MEALKAYVKGPASLQGDSSGVSTALVTVSHSNLKNYSNELRLDLHSTVESLKERLGRQCGTSPSYMLLQLFDGDNHKVCDMAEGFRPVGFYSPHDGYRVHIVDLDPGSVTAGGWLEDVSRVEKFTISDDAYNKRDDTFRKFKEKKLAEGASRSAATAQQEITDDFMADLAASIKVGDRCEIVAGQKRGEVMYVGRVEGLPAGFWIGIQCDEPVGKHDGMVKGKRYFTCPNGHGVMLRPDKLKVGDYPEIDPFEAELDEI
ncbi:tubulin-folding cofactor B-like [Selaginella moellendorffii]|uniref:tubulin-folding cofactor B-like n=1 Tax=Selaginella moellendorffii TaxID=88036 RepID=UPI000D1D07A2|nr:tubulin-folding cofactor B-like [Selaginella moellendorffii]|eukprot:XP_024542204.1 tubulin-folding cofactor B-like [Selaginella moellendorffii]